MIIQSCSKTIYLLLIEYTNKEHVQMLWNYFMDNYRKIDDHQQNDYLIYQTSFEIFQLLVGHKIIIDILIYIWNF